MGGPRQRNLTTKTRKEFREMKQQHQPKEAMDEQGPPYITGSGGSNTWLPTNYMTFKLFLTVRLAAAFWSNVSDCDETFNYWEPTHFLLYGKGFQTWEYSPEYALRSYLYILMHAVPAWIYAQVLQPNRMYVFYFVRCLLAVACSACEFYFYRGVKKHFGANVARLTLAMMVLSAGMFISGTAYLPSTTSMYLVMLSYGAWFSQQYPLAVFSTALSCFLSWPFAAILGVPIAIDMVLRRKRLVVFVRWCMISCVTILGPLIIIDSQYYGSLTLAPLNIVKYNLFTSHGPDLYGTEPWTFYLINGFLNLNVAFVAGVSVLPLTLIQSSLAIRGHSSASCPPWLVHLGMYLWLAIFMTQPHKEERFLFPIYPLLCFAAACSVDIAQKITFHALVRVKNKHYLDKTNWLGVLSVLMVALLSISRLSALYYNYHASMDVWMNVNHLHITDQLVEPGLGGNVNVCIGKEWHRFPSSFFLPDDHWQLVFLRSEFRGQLPGRYVGGENGTTIAGDRFNNLNLEETSRYFEDVTHCHYLVDLNGVSETELEPNYLLAYPDLWLSDEVISYPYLNSQKSHRFLRAFHVPFLSSSGIQYGQYVLLTNRLLVRTNRPTAP